MIYTITANPSIDYVIQLEKLNTGNVNRVQSDVKLPGGKGINVSRILAELALPSVALGFVGGFTGQFIQSKLNNASIDCRFTEVEEDTRINVKLKDNTEETEINGQGPHISAEAVANLKQQLAKLEAGDIVFMSGSLPPNLPASFYKDLIPLIQAHNAEFVIDTTGQALLDTLAEKPLVIKPNHHELAELFGTHFANQSEIIAAGRKLLDQGAQHVLVSMAGDGALLITPDHAYLGGTPKGTVINSVGAGDSMIAGFVGTFAQHHDALVAFKTSLACGSATAFSEDLATSAKINELLPQIEITQVD
ncbi:1-phosphofructokinase [Latilactobacillus curvatus]|uniref:1-phosphofructokinase n=1 Tax=Latilactobacillus curvatus TaxID=28038 RepID=UPI00084A0C3E|nr:1-phosphofructokinase [Latilactobacillus curvatus]AOO75601.1 1-phosphofructokinase [Latilactobacillus curvatus]MDT7016780.1 1-phosphofructokinase [Latilactobacillus curvatus]BBE26335.1 1-phosphofructokinase [Latilactobacillus curvatus]